MPKSSESSGPESKNKRARLATGVVVLAAGLAVGLSLFAVNRPSVDVNATGTAVASTTLMARPGADSSSTAADATGSDESTSARATTSAPATTSASTPAPATTAPPAPSAQAAPPQAEPMTSGTYTVQPGDTLSDIAAWFELNGFGDLYEANKAVIGANPDLIIPGQTITLSGAGVMMG